MANLNLVYGEALAAVRDEVEEPGDETKAQEWTRLHTSTMHVLEGTKEEIEKQLKTSLEAFSIF